MRCSFFHHSTQEKRGWQLAHQPIPLLWAPLSNHLKWCVVRCLQWSLNLCGLATHCWPETMNTLPLSEQSNVVYHIPCSCGHAGLHQREQIGVRTKTEGTSKCLQVKNDWEVSWSGVFIYKTTTTRSTGSRHPCWTWHKIEAVGEGGSVHPVELTQCFNCDGERILTNLWLPMMCILSTFHCYQIIDVS